MPKIFISYPQDAQEIAEEIKAVLDEQKHIINLRVNDDELSPAEKSSEAAIKASDLFVILVTANSEDSRFGYTHVKLAVQARKGILPVKIDAGLPPHLVDYEAIEMKGLDITPVVREIELAALKTERKHERLILRGVLLGIGLIVAFFVANTVFYPRVRSWYVANFVPTSTPTSTPTLRPTNTPRPTATPVPRYYPVNGGGELVFSREMNNGNADIFIVDLATGIETQLTDTSANEDYPSWSPDGNRIAFNTDRDGNYEIYVMDADGSNLTRLTDDEDGDYIPSWSPDGSKIVFDSSRHGRNEIYLMNADGSNQTRLTDNSFENNRASFSPDGSRIAYYASDMGFAAVFLIDPDGSNQTRLTDDSVFLEGAPVWSPNSSEILFRSNTRDLDGYELFIVNVDNANQRQLTDFEGYWISDYTWSPDGKQILFRQDNSQNNGDFYILNADGTDIRPVTDTPEHELYAQLRPQTP